MLDVRQKTMFGNGLQTCEGRDLERKIMNSKTNINMKIKTSINRLTPAFASVLLAVVLSGCLDRREPMKHEQGFVIEKQYFPDTRQTVTGTGFSSNGSVVFTTHQIGENEKYIVLFKCEHGVVFSINRNDLYMKLNKGDTVQIDYYEMVNGDGEVKDLDFVDANVR